MSNQNGQATDASLSEEFSTLKSYLLPDGALLKGMESLAQMKDTVIELDNILLQLAKTSNYSAAELKHVTEEAFRLGDAAGKAGTEVLSYINSAAQAGYGTKDALAIAQEAMKMTNLSSGIDNADTATEYLTNILEGFQKPRRSISSINDSLIGIAKTGKADFDTLAAGASKLAQSADDAGMSLEELLGLLSGAYEVLGDMDKVTNGELAIFSNLKETYGDTQNVYRILNNLNSSWSTLEDSSKESFAASIAGNDQREVFLALMDNWKGVEQAVFSASNSFGAADEANQAYLDSIAGKTATFQNQVEELSASLIHSDILKFFLDLGTVGSNALNKVTEKIGSLGTLGALAGGYLGAKNLGRANTDSCPSF